MKNWIVCLGVSIFAVLISMWYVHECEAPKEIFILLDFLMFALTGFCWFVEHKED